MRFYYDKSGKLEKIFKKVMDDNYPELSLLRWVYTFRDSEKLDEEGLPIIASVRKLVPRDRDIFDFDIMVEMDKEQWDAMGKSKKLKVVFHELNHTEIDWDDEDEQEPAVDKNDRIKFKLKPHDIVIKRFKEELNKYGLSEDEEEIRIMLNKIYKGKKLTIDKKEPKKKKSKKEKNGKEKNKKKRRKKNRKEK